MSTPETPREVHDRLWSVEEVGSYLGKTPASLATMRWRRVGPPSFKVGRHVRYRRSDVIAWVAQQVAAEAVLGDKR